MAKAKAANKIDPEVLDELLKDVKGEQDLPPVCQNFDCQSYRIIS
jgi:hypothetical protein